MNDLKTRLFGVVILAVFSVLMYQNWTYAVQGNAYSPKMAAFGPLGIVGGLFIIFFPSKAGVPKTTKDKIIVFSLFMISLGLGLLNWYLIDPRFFRG